MPNRSEVERNRLLLDQVADKWTILILAALCESGGRARFNAIRRAVDCISQKTLTKCLRELERNGILERTLYDTTPISVEYKMSALGHSLKKPFAALYEWADLHLAEVEAAQRSFDKARPR